MITDRDVERVLVIVAHPGDAEFWAGGAIARWTGAGIEVTYCVLTDGDGGGSDLATGAAVLRAIHPDASNPFALIHLQQDKGLEPWAVQESLAA